uniref:RNase H domain-containing protein n=1 Tax=Rhabditophanes sp. KR3021 TaxID=114890 RepID=A0AC35TQR4_9BILA
MTIISTICYRKHSKHYKKEIVQKILQSDNEYLSSAEKSVDILIFESSSSSNPPLYSIDAESQFQSLIANSPCSYVFVDGSTKFRDKHPSAGFGYFACANNCYHIRGRTLEPCSSDKAEVQAFLDVVKVCKNLETPVIFLTDSSYVFNSINSGWSHRLATEEQGPHKSLWAEIQNQLPNPTRHGSQKRQP